MMAAITRGVILVGHGGIPKGCPQEFSHETETAGSSAACREDSAFGGRT